jgi:hypothetical protein
VCAKVIEIIVILRHSDQPLARCVLKVLGNLSPRGNEVQTCVTTTTVDEGIVEGQQHMVDVNTNCSTARPEAPKQDPASPTKTLYSSDNQLNTKGSVASKQASPFEQTSTVIQELCNASVSSINHIPRLTLKRKGTSWINHTPTSLSKELS